MQGVDQAADAVKEGADRTQEYADDPSKAVDDAADALEGGVDRAAAGVEQGLDKARFLFRSIGCRCRRCRGDLEAGVVESSVQALRLSPAKLLLPLPPLHVSPWCCCI